MNERQAQLQISDIYTQLRRLRSDLDVLPTTLPTGTTTTTTTTPPTPGQAVNQLRNGSFAHSWQSWFPVREIDPDGDYECAWWYSHDDAAGTAMTLTATSNPATTSSIGGATFTFSNPTEDYSMDCDATTIDEVADILYSLWKVLNDRGYLG